MRRSAVCQLDVESAPPHPAETLPIRHHTVCDHQTRDWKLFKYFGMISHLSRAAFKHTDRLLLHKYQWNS